MGLTNDFAVIRLLVGCVMGVCVYFFFFLIEVTGLQCCTCNMSSWFFFHIKSLAYYFKRGQFSSKISPRENINPQLKVLDSCVTGLLECK